MKLVISENGKSYSKELGEDEASRMKGMKIGDSVNGELFGIAGYELRITGGSSKAGFPMIQGAEGERERYALLSKPPGYKPKRKGCRKRKRIAGNVIGENTAQVNLKVVKKGPEPLDKLLGNGKKEGS